MTARAKVILKKSATYTFRGRRWIKDVPALVSGEEEVKAYSENGFFHTVKLKSEKKSKKVDDSDTGDKKSKGKGKLKK